MADRWGVVRNFTDETLHVVPIVDCVDDDGDVAPPHILSTKCQCQPALDQKPGKRPLIIHEEIH